MHARHPTSYLITNASLNSSDDNLAKINEPKHHEGCYLVDYGMMNIDKILFTVIDI